MMMPAARVRMPGRLPRKRSPRIPMMMRPILCKSGVCRQRNVKMATMRVGMLLANATMGTIRTSHSKMVVSIASVAGSSVGAMIDRSEGKKNQAQIPAIIFPTNSIMKKIPAMRVSVRAVLILILIDTPFHDSKARALPK